MTVPWLPLPVPGLPEPTSYPPMPSIAPAAVPSLDLLSIMTGGVNVIAKLPYVVAYAMIGSATYRHDAEDVDFAVHVSVEAISYIEAMRADGWMPCSEYDTSTGSWASTRRGHLNLMVTHDGAFFEGYKRATEVCKALNLVNKHDRIVVCRIVRDGMTAEAARNGPKK